MAMTPFIGWFPIGTSLTAGETLCETSESARWLTNGLKAPSAMVSASHKRIGHSFTNNCGGQRTANSRPIMKGWLAKRAMRPEAGAPALPACAAA